MKVLFVGGTFDDNGGKPSSLVAQFAIEIMKYHKIVLYNGGYFENLTEILESVSDYDTVFWWANVPNDKPKIRDVKAINPKAMLIGSKRNDNGKYNYQQLISFALERKQNLVVTFSKEDEKTFRFTIYDPLGNEWYNGYDVETCTELLMSRLAVISKVTRIGTEHKLKNKIDLTVVPETLDWCDTHFVPAIKEHITCKRFGKPDGMDGGCHWCAEMTPYQFKMCGDEYHANNLLSPLACRRQNTIEEAREYVQEHKIICDFEVDEEYLEVIKRYAEDFHRLIMPEPTNRFLGNSSFRCTKGGFPSFRDGEFIYVSRRNIDKEHIDRIGFVPVYAHREEGEKVAYLGDHKPSVDTPVQLALYEMFPNINFMIHSHTYVKDGIFTEFPLPCGAFEEVAEIDKVTPDKEKNFYAINLIGHGCLIMSNDVKKLKDVEFCARPIPDIRY